MAASYAEPTAQGSPTPSRADEAWSAARRIARELDKVLDGSGPRQLAIDRAAAETAPLDPTGLQAACGVPAHQWIFAKNPNLVPSATARGEPGMGTR